MSTGDAVQRLSRRAAAGDISSARALVALLEQISGPAGSLRVETGGASKVLAEEAAEGDLSSAQALVLLLSSSSDRGPRLVSQYPTAKAAMTAPGAIVLRELARGPDDSEWVTQWRNDQTGGHSESHYFSGESAKRDASIDFAARVRQYVERYL